jgi:hypothetical protein
MMPTVLAHNLDALTRRYGSAPALENLGASDSRDGSQLGQAAAAPGVLPDPCPAVLSGIGAGLAQLLTTTPSRCRLLIIEPDPHVARQVLATRSWVDEIDQGRLALLIGPDYPGLTAIARAWPEAGRAPVVVDPDLSRRRPEAETAGRAVLERLHFQTAANNEARRQLAGRYLLHTLRNLPQAAREGDVRHLEGAFADQPAIIVAAGPSLDRNLHEAAPFFDRGLILACDTAAWPLVTTGVVPHVIVAVDASEANARHLSSLPPLAATLVTEASVHPSAVQPFHDRTFFFKVSDHDPWPWFRTLGLDRGRLEAWGSVATTALALALELGCNPIVFIGADFAFTDGRPYCRGTSLETIWASWVAGGQSYDDVWRHLLGRWPLESAIDLAGRPTATSSHLLAFRDWVRERATARPDRVIVNATGAGLLTGPAIRQASIASTLGPARIIDRAAVTRRLRERHSAPAVDHAALWAEVSSVVAGLDPALLERWQVFTSGTVSGDAMRAALASPEQQAFAIGAQLRRRLVRVAS